ncbi:lysine-specific histone demethylase 1B-like isoform X1 [Biomphalaria glabrata]|uniref:Lysine-specific histone demethylase 2-like isoform X1 n=1 Tax=Biomphalaria glabrata TaxID=6526 RepID=A0A9U8DXY5_BIOGL|nr:lysine-specific histone demethylase 2-like isoform X1 [Biomphalaria glabrata]XP_013064926.2 lysine-specific histone demethylase 2-like isoform X1 [Biomphalaria glabrata]KAI8736875.1 lysine-specific histone demethylase 1B-like isoform X1 [Biomphalaria glabrata]
MKGCMGSKVSEIHVSMKRSGRQIKPNTKYIQDDDKNSGGPKKECGRSGCLATRPICFARVSERCAGSNWTSRWYHITPGEHYCNECFEFFYRSHKAGYAEYDKWKRLWAAKARTEASVTSMMIDQVLPYWVQCRASGCGKWRQLTKDSDLTEEFIATFQCGMTTTKLNPSKKMKFTDCSIPQDERVHYVHSPLWLIHNKCTAFFKKSPAAPFLSAYYPDGVGISPTEAVVELTKSEKEKLCPYIAPFPKGDQPLQAFVVTPDMMLESEIEEFPLMAQECPYVYLAIRNLVLVIWALNPKEWVTKERCMSQLICRGLIRVTCIELLPQILSFLTCNNFINQGLVKPSPTLVYNTNSQNSVVVIGAGASGLAAAYQLNSHGFEVIVLESKDRLGGRVNDIIQDGMVLPTGGQMLNGCYNNPMAIMAFQIGIELEEQTDICQLITDSGALVDDRLDRRIEFHYNAILDIVSEWRKSKKEVADVPLLYKFKELHEEFVHETQGYFSVGVFLQEEERLIDFHHSSLEYACGTSLDKVSALHWDQNELLPQFGGPHMKLTQGFGSVLTKLGEGLDIRLNTKVTDIDYSGQKIVVKSNSGTFQADKVLVTLPLAVLKAGTVNFKPQLPPSKLKAICSLGAGLVEKVMLQFDHNFWSKKEELPVFGCIPKSESHRGLFNVFYSYHCKQSGKHVLSSYLVGNGLSQMQGKSDEEIVHVFLEILRSIFPDKEIPTPCWSTVTHWAADPDISMAYSYIPVGCDGEAYHALAETVEDKIYFAGEATNRQFPQTVSGAYLCGVHEARKIIQSFN